MYPLTDVEDANASTANVGPGGLMSADEFSAEGDKQSKGVKSRIQIVGYDANANPTV